jgi:predicted transglutaminase-like cysteine proteinase
MLRRGAAFAFAVCILVWPAGAGSDTDTFWSTPSAAVLAATSAPTLEPAFDPAQQQVAETAEAAPTEQSAGKDQAPLQNTSRADVPARTAALDPVQTKIPPSPALPPALQPAPAQQQVASAAAEASPADKSDGADEAQRNNNTHADGSARTAALDPVQPEAPPSPPVSEPFGLNATPVWFGQVLTKWHGVVSRIRADNDVFARCAQGEQRCPQGARNFLAIVAQGRALSGLARIGVINRAVNLAIEPMSDMAQWGVPDRWSPPLETFTTGRGDCEDYAIAKYVALTAAGVPARDVKLVIVRNTAANEDHAIVAVRDGGDWIMLDNRWLTLVKDVAMPKTIPEFVLDDAGVREFVPPAIAVAQRMPAPASVRF